MTALSRLRSLYLTCMMLGPDAYGPLLSLPALECLELVAVALPSCLSRLTRLRTLRWAQVQGPLLAYLLRNA